MEEIITKLNTLINNVHSLRNIDLELDLTECLGDARLAVDAGNEKEATKIFKRANNMYRQAMVGNYSGSYASF